MASLPAEIWLKIADHAIARVPTFSPHVRGAPTRPRTAVLLSLSRICRAAHLALRDKLLTDIAVFTPQQLSRAAALLEADPERRALPTSLEIFWTVGSFWSTRREGAKKWRAGVVRFTKVAKGLRKFSLTGPLPLPWQDKKEEPYFDPGWLEEVSDTLTELSLSHIRLATYDQVAHIRYSKLEVLRLIQCTDQDTGMARCTGFFKHFPPLREFHFVDLAAKEAATRCLFEFVKSEACSAHLKRLTLPCLPFAKHVAPATPSNRGYLHIPSSITHLTLTDSAQIANERFEMANEVFLHAHHSALEEVVYLICDEVIWSYEDKVQEIEMLLDQAEVIKPKVTIGKLEEVYYPFPERW